MSGLILLNWWGYVLVTLLLTHITIVSVTIYLHRHQAHRALELHPVVSHSFRFWLWLTTGINTKEWVAIHRKHHATVEQSDDPHSPVIYGINKVMWEGYELYRKEGDNKQTLIDYGHQTPDDWLERNLYTAHGWSGIILMLFIDLVLFGAIGITIWAVQMIWIPFFAAGVINGVGHWFGYRNFDSPDASRNIIPIGIIIGGEEMHNNHHAFASSARFSNQWWEFDIGWFYICCMRYLGLARIKKVFSRPYYNYSKYHIDLETVHAVVSHRLYLLSDYARYVIEPVVRKEMQNANDSSRKSINKMKSMLTLPQFSLDKRSIQQLEHLLEENDALKKVYNLKQQLLALWQDKTATYETLQKRLQDWCKEAEASGINALEEFAINLRCCSMQIA